jgi:uncharacterized membrane protein YagU involved in acid resistance
MNNPQGGAGFIGTLSPAKAILYGTLVAGALDATDGVVFFGLQGLNPVQVLQYIASGLIGQRAFHGGLATAGLGAVLHFGIAAVVAAIYVAASLKLAVLRQQPFVLGPLYGAAVYLVMNLIVLPMSAVAHTPITTAALLNGLLGHAFFVGMPIALFARKSAA